MAGFAVHPPQPFDIGLPPHYLLSIFFLFNLHFSSPFFDSEPSFSIFSMSVAKLSIAGYLFGWRPPLHLSLVSTAPLVPGVKWHHPSIFPLFFFFVCYFSSSLNGFLPPPILTRTVRDHPSQPFSLKPHNTFFWDLMLLPIRLFLFWRIYGTFSVDISPPPYSFPFSFLRAPELPLRK